MHLTVKRYFDDTFAILDRNSVGIVCSLCSRRLSVIVWGARQSRAGAYSMTRDSKYTWNILLESGLFFRIQIEYSRMT